MNKQEWSTKRVVLLATFCSTVVAGLLLTYFDFQFDKKHSAFEMELSLAHEDVRVREGYIRDIELLSTEFDVKFRRFSLQLMNDNSISPNLREDLLTNLQKQTISIISLQNVMPQNESTQDIGQSYQDHVDLAREIIFSISDAGEMRGLFLVFEEMKFEQQELSSAVRSLPLMSDNS